MRYALAFVLLSVLLLLPVACTPSSSRELSGRYHAETDAGNSVLVLGPDGTFSQTVAAERIEGSWGYADGHVVIKPCLSVARDGFGKRIDVCSMDASRTPVGVELSVDPDYGIAFRKQK